MIAYPLARCSRFISEFTSRHVHLRLPIEQQQRRGNSINIEFGPCMGKLKEEKARWKKGAMMIEYILDKEGTVPHALSHN
jgi:hypothetical protein